MKEITISPVTRIEGHAGVRIYLNDRGGEVDSAHFQVVELRGDSRSSLSALQSRRHLGSRPPAYAGYAPPRRTTWLQRRRPTRSTASNRPRPERNSGNS